MSILVLVQTQVSDVYIVRCLKDLSFDDHSFNELRCIPPKFTLKVLLNKL